MLTEVRLLEHLSYIIEALAEELPGEAKFETGRLLENVRNDTNLPIEVRTAAIASLTRALGPDVDGRPMPARGVAACLSSLSRFLWERALEREP